MNLFWDKINDNFYNGFYKDNKPVHIFYEFEVKLNFNYIFKYSKKELFNLINQCIQEFFNIWVEKKWMYEGENPNRLISEDKLKLVNNHINTLFRMDWCPKGIKVRNIKITHLI